MSVLEGHLAEKSTPPEGAVCQQAADRPMFFGGLSWLTYASRWLFRAPRLGVMGWSCKGKT
jgi:hypothetical protein